MSKKGRVKYGGASYSRARDRLDSEEDEFEIDPTKPLGASLRNTLKEIVAVEGEVSKARRIAHLNGLVKLWAAVKSSSELEPDLLQLDEVMLCLRIPLSQDFAEVRAATLRAFRYLISSEDNVEDFIKLNCHCLVARCLDIDLDNKIERIQALRLMRKIAFLAPSKFPLLLCRSLVAIAEGGKKEDDRLHRVSVACLCEISVLNHQVFIEANGVSALTFCLLDTSLARVSEAILACLLRLYNNPATRNEAKVELGIIVAPFTEFRYVHSGLLQLPGAPGGDSSLADEKNRRFSIAEHAILSLIRSWTGLLQMAQAKPYGGSNLQALVDILYLENDEVRRRLVFLFFEVLNVRIPKDMSSTEAIMKVSDPSNLKESWKLADGFVASEGLDILPHLAKSRPNLVENHKSFVLSCLLKTGLPKALVQVIISTKQDLSLMATTLLGELLYSASMLLPRELNVVSHCLPALLDQISGTNLKKSNRASEAVEVLEKIHSMKKRGPVACTLFLDQIMTSSGRQYGESFIGDRLQSPSWSSEVKHSSDEQVKQSLRDSKILDSKDYRNWDWELIAAILRWPSETFVGLDHPSHKLFITRLVEFYKPTLNLFSKIELENPKAKTFAKIGCHLIDFLVSRPQDEASFFIDELLSDIWNCLESLTTSRSVRECLLSPTRVATTASQFYFLFIGRISYSVNGRALLDRHKFLNTLSGLLSLDNDLYLKLVISCLDYTHYTATDWGARNLLCKALKEGPEPGKVYATKLLGVLIRSKIPNIAQWGIELLVRQLFDESARVSWVALDLLDEACDDKMNLEAVVCTIENCKIVPEEKASLDYLGIHGAFLRNRLYTSSNSVKLLTNTNPEGKRVIDAELEKWTSEWNDFYVIVIEDLLNDGLTRHQRNDDRCYGRRSHEAHTIRDVYVPSHLYGQLAMTQFGLRNLTQDPTVLSMIKLLRSVPVVLPSQDWLKTKSAIWALSSIALSPEGVLFVEGEGVISSIIYIAETNKVLSIRGTAFYALGMVATTRHGSNILSKYGWCSLRYGRNDRWPVPEDWFYKFQNREWESAGEDFEELGPENITVVPRAYEININAGHSHSLESPLDFSRCASVESGDSSPKGSTSLLGRQRLSSFFRSFNLGSGGSLSLSQGNRRSSEANKSLTAKIKKSFFPRSRAHSHSSSGIDEGDDQGDSFCKNPSSVSPLKTVLEVEKQAPIATPDSSEDSSTQGEHRFLGEKDQSMIEKGKPCLVEAKFVPPKDVGLSRSIRTDEVVSKLSPISKPKLVKENLSSSKKEEYSDFEVNGKVGISEGFSFGPHLDSKKEGLPWKPEEVPKNLTESTPVKGSFIGLNETTICPDNLAENDPSKETKTRLAAKTKLVLDCSNIEPTSGTKLSPIASSPIDNPFKLKIKASNSTPSHVASDEKVQRSRIVVRSGQRALSESEAQNLTGTTSMSCKRAYGTITANAKDSKYAWSITSMSSAGSWTENPGYLTFRNLYNRRRPPLSESDSDPTGPGTQPVREGHHPDFAHGTRVHRTDSWSRKSRSLDYRQTKLRHRQRPSHVDSDLIGQRSFSAPPVRPPVLNLENTNVGPEPQYWGITLPLRLESIFPATEEPYTDFIQEFDLSCILIETPVTQNLDIIGLEHHTHQQCLACFRFYQKYQDEMDFPRPEVISQRKYIIKLITCMQATVGAKTAEQGLLKFKQSYPEAFSDLCLYSEVCILLTKYAFRMTSRRFIQELFMDIKYTEMYTESNFILGLTNSDDGENNPNTSLALVVEAAVEENLSSNASSPFS